jgi:hypothetical protein
MIFNPNLITFFNLKKIVFVTYENAKEKPIKPQNYNRKENKEGAKGAKGAKEKTDLTPKNAMKKQRAQYEKRITAKIAKEELRTQSRKQNRLWTRSKKNK